MKRMTNPYLSNTDAAPCIPVTRSRTIRNCSRTTIGVIIVGVATVLAQKVVAAENTNGGGQSQESGQWIPLPFYREQSWWLPVDPIKPLRINAEWIVPIGKTCYRAHIGEGREALLDESGRLLLEAVAIWQLDGNHFGFLNAGKDLFSGVVGSDGSLIVRPTLIRSQLEERYADAEWSQKAKTPLPQVPGSLGQGSGYSIELNSQGKVETRAFSYCAETGLLAVALEDPGSGKELQVWDVHSRCCVWRQPLDGAAGIAGVSLLPNGRIFVSGGMFKWCNVNYVAVYDLASRRQIARHKIQMNREPGWLRVLPISKGDEYLALAPAVAQTKETMGIFRMNSQTGITNRAYQTPFQVSSLAILPGEKTLIVGGEKGQIARIDLDSGRLSLLPFNAGSMISSMATNRSGNHLAVGTSDGSLLSCLLDNSQKIRRKGGLNGEVTSVAILEDGSSRIAARVSGQGASPFLLVNSVDTTRFKCPGVLWDSETGKVTPLPVGSGLSVIDARFLALGDHERGLVAIHDLVTGTAVSSLGQREENGIKPPISDGYVSLDLPKLYVRVGGKSVRMTSEVFDFQSMTRRSDEVQGGAAQREIYARNPKDEAVFGLGEFGAGLTLFERAKNDRYGLSNDFSKQVFRLGSDRRPSVVLLRDEPLLNRDESTGRLSPSGKRAVVSFGNRFGTEIRLVDLEGMKLMSQPNVGGKTEELVIRGHSRVWLIDEEGHRLLCISDPAWNSLVGGNDSVANQGGALIEMVDYAGGKTIAQLAIDVDVSEAVACPEARRLFILGSDDMLHVLEWNDDGMLRVVGRLKLGSEGAWTAMLPNGIFAGTGVESALSLGLSRSALPLEIAAPFFHQPHGVAEAFGASKETVARLRKAFERRGRRDGVAQSAESVGQLTRLPLASIVGRSSLPLATSEETLPLDVQASAENSPLVRLCVSVNNVPLGMREGTSIEKTQSWRGAVNIPLSVGSNSIQVSVVDDAGHESLRDTIVVERHSSVKSGSKVFVVAVGVSDYADNELDLGAAAKDAGDVCRLLTRSMAGPSVEVKTMLITDADATREHILDMRKFLESSTIGDTVIVFFAGHGFVDAKGLRYWFGTHDIDWRAVDKRGVNYEEIEGLFDGLAARRRLLLMDTCFAGVVDTDSVTPLQLAKAVKSRSPAIATVIPKPADGSFDLMQEMFGDVRRSTGATVITASAGMEFVFAEERAEGDNGVFTYALLNGIRNGGADLNGDGDIRISELHTYLSAVVRQMTGGRQRPTGRQLNHDMDFSIGRTGGPSALRSASVALGTVASGLRAAGFPGERFPDTRLRMLDQNDLLRMNLADIQYAINELFARHGAWFPQEELRRNFGRFPWYRPKQEADFDAVEKEFSTIEKANLIALAGRRSQLK